MTITEIASMGVEVALVWLVAMGVVFVLTVVASLVVVACQEAWYWLGNP